LRSPAEKSAARPLMAPKHRAWNHVTQTLPRLKKAVDDPNARAHADAVLNPNPAKPGMVSARVQALRNVFPFRRKNSAAKHDPHASATCTERGTEATQPSPQMQHASGFAQKLRGYRPTRGHIALAAFVLLLLFRPWLVFGLTVLSIIILIGAFLSVGYDGFWQGVIKVTSWYAKRRPSRAAHLHARLDRFAMRWDAFLDRFPEGTVDGLYLPDLNEMATAEKRHEEALDRRLSGLQG